MWRNGKKFKEEQAPIRRPLPVSGAFTSPMRVVQIEDYTLHFRPFKQRSNFSHDLYPATRDREAFK